MGEPAAPILRNVEEFLAWEEGQPERYELVGGVIRLMAGGSANHDLIAVNVARALGNRLTGTPCRVHGSNLKVRSSAGSVMYPDAFVRCGPHRGDVTSVDDPVLVVEVLSPSTEQHDLTRKRWAYQTIAGLQTVLFIDPDRSVVELVTREADDTWRSRVVEGIDASLALGSLRIELPLEEIYAGADMEPSEAGMIG
jgi:Uma2 family endonuclease